MSFDNKNNREYAELLNRCDRELGELYHSYASRHNISDAALWILYAVYEAKDAVTQADISAVWSFSRQTINTALGGLLRQGIVELIPMPENHKSKQVRLTPEGQNTARRILSPLLQAENRVFDALSDEEKRIFAELSRKQCSLLRKYLEG